MFLVWHLIVALYSVQRKQKPKPISIVCFQTVRDRNNLLPLQISFVDIVGTELSDQKLSDLLTVVMLGRANLNVHCLVSFVLEQFTILNFES